MILMRLGFICLISLLLSCFSIAEERKLLLGVGNSQLLDFKGLSRAAVANGKLVKLKSIPPTQLLVTGKSKGNTQLTVWLDNGLVHTYAVSVIESDLWALSNANGNNLQTSGRVIQVSLEFVELEKVFSRELGIRWPDVMQFSANGAYQMSASFSGLNYTASFGTAQGLIRHLVRQGWAEIIAHPDLYVRLGEEANFHSGGEYPIATSRGSYGNFHRHIEWKPYGLSVRVRPRSGDGLLIRSDIHVEISELNHSLQVEGIPAITRRTLVTKMDSIDGETVILSGLVRQALSNHTEKLPLLGQIPLLGSLLFGAGTKTKQQNEILMAVTLSFVSSKKAQSRWKHIRRMRPENYGKRKNP